MNHDELIEILYKSKGRKDHNFIFKKISYFISIYVCLNCKMNICSRAYLLYPVFYVVYNKNNHSYPSNINNSPSLYISCNEYLIKEIIE